MTQKPAPWIPELPVESGEPIYRRIVAAMAADIAGGRLQPGERLPTHRSLADALGIDLTTVTRAYNEAQRRGLTQAVVGRGTYVRRASAAGPNPEASRAAPPSIDTGMNPPPVPTEAGFRARLTAATQAILEDDLGGLLSYRPNAGSPRDRAGGVAWLRPLLPDLAPDRVLVCGGAQAALLALLTTFTRPGDCVLTDALTYPGFRALAGQLGIRLKGLEMDSEGISPDALEAACRGETAKALYCIPTMQNPTTATMSMARRQAIVKIARRYQLPIIEDDAYGLLPRTPLPPLAAMAPELGYYVSSLAKCVAPALRLAYLAVPDASQATRLGAAIRATTMMAPPLSVAVMTRWIGDGSALEIAAAIRTESTARQTLAAEILAGADCAAHPQGHHLWLRLPPGWSGAEFAAQARSWNLAVVPRSAFAVNSGEAENAVRIALGAAPDRAQLAGALRLAADALTHLPEVMSNAG